MKNYLTYGFGLSAVSFLVLIIMFVAGMLSNPESLGTTLMISMPVFITINVVGIVLGTKADRGVVGPAGYSYGQAFKAGLMVTVFAILAGMVCNFIYYQFINPGWADVQIAWTKSFMEKMNVPEARMEKALEDARAKATVVRQIINGCIGGLIFGTVISLITAAIMKRAPSDELDGVPPLKG